MNYGFMSRRIAYEFRCLENFKTPLSYRLFDVGRLS